MRYGVRNEEKREKGEMEREKRKKKKTLIEETLLLCCYISNSGFSY